VDGEGNGGGKGEIRGMKWMTSVGVARDSGVGAVNTHTSELSTRYPVGLSVLSAMLVGQPPCFLTVRGGKRELDEDCG
jgi:hypothetical protein